MDKPPQGRCDMCLHLIYYNTSDVTYIHTNNKIIINHEQKTDEIEILCLIISFFSN